MYYLIFSIVCSVAVSILLKISKSKGISINQAVAINYPVAAISAFVLFKPNFSNNFNILLSEWQNLLSLKVLRFCVRMKKLRKEMYMDPVRAYSIS